MCLPLIRPCRAGLTMPAQLAPYYCALNLRLFAPSLSHRTAREKRAKKCQMTCKPGSVTAAIAADDGYSSRMAVTSHLKQPTRT